MSNLAEQGGKIIRNRIVQHLLFWIFSFYVLLRLFTYSDEARRAIFTFSGVSASDIVYTLLFHISLAAGVYINLLWLIPSFFQPRRFIYYVVLFAGVAVLCTYLNILTFEKIADVLFPGYYFISYYEFRDIFQFVFIYMSAATLLKLSKAWFDIREKERRINQLEREKTEAEMTALKSQVDPHFLFNNLNNLYSLALDGDKRTPELILKLSQTMQYMIYECSDKYVPLEKELEYIANYLDLQRLRSDERARIVLNVEGTASSRQVAPLLFIPFIENGFKHGVKGTAEAPFIHISFHIEGDELDFRVENNKGRPDEFLRKKHSGIGLQNIRRRLELLYPGKHELNIREDDEKFCVHLRLNTV
jgi:sensor histidine kinase YesM